MVNETFYYLATLKGHKRNAMTDEVNYVTDKFLVEAVNYTDAEIRATELLETTYIKSDENKVETIVKRNYDGYYARAKSDEDEDDELHIFEVRIKVEPLLSDKPFTEKHLVRATCLPEALAMFRALCSRTQLEYEYQSISILSSVTDVVTLKELDGLYASSSNDNEPTE